MKLSTRIASFTALGLAALMCTGCIKFHQTLTLMPDGSGKIEYTMGANTALFKQLGQGDGKSPLDDFKISEAAESMEGIVAFTKPTEKAANGWEYRSFTAYFEDINKVKFDKDDPNAPTFAYTAEGDKHVLTVKNAPIAKMAADMGQGGQIPDDPAQQAQMKMMFSGFEVVETYTMPAKITEAPGMTTEARTGTAKLNDTMMFDKAKMAELAKVSERKVTAEGDAVAAADVAAFKAELEKAKAEWETMKKELEAAPAPAE